MTPIANWSPTHLVLAWLLAGFAGGLTEPVLAAIAPALAHTTIDKTAVWLRGTIAVVLLVVTVRWYRGWRAAAKGRVAQALAGRRKPW